MNYSCKITAEDKVLVRFTDAEGGIDVNYDLFFTVSFVLKSAENTAAVPIEKLTLEKAAMSAADAVKLSYMTVFSDGMSQEQLDAGKPDAGFTAEAEKAFKVGRVAISGLELAEFEIEKHSISEQDRAQWDSMQEMKRLRDPEAAVEHYMKISGLPVNTRGYVSEQITEEKLSRLSFEFPAKAGEKPEASPNNWVCSCGRVNKGKFCRDCGNPRSMDKWVCSCGSVNTGKFCRDCGNPRGE